MAAPIPDPHSLLPALLACLPTAFVSPRPPPALLPLLSPILRQRLQYSADTTGQDGWLPLLSWDPQCAAKLGGKIEGLQLEPHPVSGELEIEDVDRTEYRKLDEETLQTRFILAQHDLLPIYVWCEADTQGGSPGWKLAELRAIEDSEDGTEWYGSIEEAQDAAPAHVRPNGTSSAQKQAQEDDDDYWAAYDRTPGRTPAQHSPAPPSSHVFSQDRDSPGLSRSTAAAEDDYYARYASVQPAMDNHDPDEAPSNPSDSTLNGIPNKEVSSLQDRTPQPQSGAPTVANPDDRPTQRSLYPADPPSHKTPSFPDSAIATLHPSHSASHDLSPTLAVHPPNIVAAPRAISPSSSTSDKSVERLENHARVEADMTRAETGVKHFIGSEVRNLFRLARSVGMEVGEFRECVERELEVVGMLEDA